MLRVLALALAFVGVVALVGVANAQTPKQNQMVKGTVKSINVEDGVLIVLQKVKDETVVMSSTSRARPRSLSRSAAKRWNFAEGGVSAAELLFQAGDLGVGMSLRQFRSRPNYVFRMRCCRTMLERFSPRYASHLPAMPSALPVPRARFGHPPHARACYGTTQTRRHLYLAVQSTVPSANGVRQAQIRRD